MIKTIFFGNNESVIMIGILAEIVVSLAMFLGVVAFVPVVERTSVMIVAAGSLVHLLTDRRASDRNTHQ